MLKLKTLAKAKPVLFSLLALLLGSLLTEIPLKSWLAPQVGVQPAHYLALILEQGLTGALFFWLLVISESTTKTHVGNLLRKLHLDDRTQAAVYAWKEGIMRR